MPNLKTEHYGSGDQSWLGSTHGIGNARTVTLDVSTFTKNTHYPDGYLKSGLPLAIVSGKAALYVSGGTGGAENLAGFLLFDVKTDGTTDTPGALLDHGRVRLSKLPVTVTAPAAANDKTTFVFTA